MQNHTLYSSLLQLELSVSEGAYIRSYCELFAKKLGINATLSSLERTREGEFFIITKKLKCVRISKFKAQFH